MTDTTNHALALKFSAMPEGVFQRWIDWALRHDWCRSAGGSTGFYVTTYDGEYIRFETPQELRDWAGY